MGLCKMGHFVVVGLHECVDCRNARSRCYFMHNRASMLADQRRYCDANRESVRARNRKYQRAKKDKLAPKARAWREANRERKAAVNLAWQRANRDKVSATQARRSARKRGAVGSHTLDEWNAVVKKQRARCLDCKRKVKLERDHVIPISEGGSGMICNIVGRCRSCNAKKHARIIPGTQSTIFDRVKE